MAEINGILIINKEKGWTSIAKIPVVITPTDGSAPYELTANSDGTAPGKVCAKVGVRWAKEKVKLDDAYPNWKTYVNTLNPKDWDEDCVEENVCPDFFSES